MARQAKLRAKSGSLSRVTAVSLRVTTHSWSEFKDRSKAPVKKTMEGNFIGPAGIAQFQNIQSDSKVAKSHIDYEFSLPYSSWKSKQYTGICQIPFDIPFMYHIISIAINHNGYGTVCDHGFGLNGRSEYNVGAMGYSHAHTISSMQFSWTYVADRLQYQNGLITIDSYMDYDSSGGYVTGNYNYRIIYMIDLFSL